MQYQNQNPTTISRTGVAIITGIVLLLATLIIPAVNRAREAARRIHSKNTLKSVGIALHNYHNAFRVFPPGGVFDANGTAHHEWTTFLSPYLDSGSWYNEIDFRIPWDDPQQVDLFRNDHHGQKHYWFNPALPDPVRPDGLISNCYAGSQTVFFRNSSVSLKHLGEATERLLVADAFGQFLPVGAPYGWRDITLGIGRDPGGFGCPVGEITQCLMADGRVRELPRNVDQDVLEAMAGPAKERPPDEQVRRMSAYPLLDLTTIWTIEKRVIEDDDGSIGPPRVEYLRTSPDARRTLRER